MTTSRTCFACVLVLFGCVCCTVPVPPVTVVERVTTLTTTPPSTHFLHYVASLRAFSLEALQREHARQETAFTTHPSAENRLRLVWLLSLPSTAFANRPYARELLQAYLHAPAPPDTDLLDLAIFLATCLQEPPPVQLADPRVKPLQADVEDKERQLLTQQQRVKKLQEELETQRLLHQQLQRQLQETVSEKNRHLTGHQQLYRKLLEERRNVKKLQEKIEKIKDIEKSLMDRERTDKKGT